MASELLARVARIEQQRKRKSQVGPDARKLECGAYKAIMAGAKPHPRSLLGIRKGYWLQLARPRGDQSLLGSSWLDPHVG